MQTPRVVRILGRLSLVVAFGLTMWRGDVSTRAQDEPAQEKTLAPIGQFVTVTHPVDAALEGRVRSLAMDLQSRALKEQRKAVLVLEITEGDSRYGDVRELAEFLSTGIPAVTTVAWIPRDVRGYNVILALACNEIVMSETASIGDIGRGQPVKGDAQSFVAMMVNRRHNSKLSEALVLGMMDPAKEVVWVQVEMESEPQPVLETRIVSPTEFDRLLKTKVPIKNHQTIKQSGTDGVFSGAQSRALNFLASHTAITRDDVQRIYNLPTEAMRERLADGEIKPRRIEVKGGIDGILADFVDRQINEALLDRVNLMIFEIDSPGGRYDASKRLANQIADLQSHGVRTVAYIPDAAYSGAAMIALGCDDIYMHPNAKIGDAGPIEIGEDGAFRWVEEKLLSAVTTDLRDLANRKHRPPALAMSMADRKLKVFKVHNEDGDIWYMSEQEIDASEGKWIKGPQVQQSAPNLLTVTGEEAHELLLARTPVRSFDEFKREVGVDPNDPLPPAKRSWVDTLVFVLNTDFMRGLMFTIGFMCAIIEIYTAHGFFGICSALCFSLFFWSHFGRTAGWLEVVLFMVGLGCIALEVFVIPGFGVFGVTGGLLILVSLVLASQTFVIPVSSIEYEEFAHSLGVLSGAILACVFLAIILGRLLPQTPLFNHMVLTPPGAELATDGPRLRPEFDARNSQYGFGHDKNQELIGRHGTAHSVLRPAGKALFGDKLVDVVSDGPFVEQGSPVEVVEVLGNRVVVREVS